MVYYDKKNNVRIKNLKGLDDGVKHSELPGDRWVSSQFT
jgi:hypothetical protein